jgi:hypothetical protein
MAADVKNIIVGAAQLFVSNGTGNNRPSDTRASALFPTASISARAKLLGDATNWRDVGYTNNGLEVSYEPGYNDVMVDQLLDAARLFKSTIKVMLKTELSEGTLQNLNLVFGQQESQFTYSGSVGSASNVLTGTYTGGTSTGSAQLSIAAGSLGDAPVERSLVAVGNAPGNLTISASGTPTGATSASAAVRTERVYVARRVVQIEVTSHSLKRDSATTFPVQFRCLPDDDDKYDGAEYGVIIDRVTG